MAPWVGEGSQSVREDAGREVVGGEGKGLMAAEGVETGRMGMEGGERKRGSRVGGRGLKEQRNEGAQA